MACLPLYSLCQGLEMIAPVLSQVKYGVPDTNVSFILTPTNSLQIVDARQPWPPRWFVVGSDHTKDDVTNNALGPFQDARFQNGYLTFFKSLPNSRKRGAYIICDQKMELIDSFTGFDLPINPHDFRINKNGEKLFAGKIDTMIYGQY